MAHGIFNSQLFNNSIFNTHEAIEIAGTQSTQQLTSKARRPEQLITTEFTFRLFSRTIPTEFHEVLTNIKNMKPFGVFSNDLNNLLLSPVTDLRNFVEQKMKVKEKIRKRLNLAEKMARLSKTDLAKLIFRIRHDK